jgi:dihydroneopterin aldolase
VTDRIELRGLRVLGTHGALAEEATRAQPCEVDLDVVTDMRKAGTTDDLADAVDYGELTGRVASLIGREHHTLLERLAERIADDVLSDPRVISVTVTLRKLRPPVPHDLASAGVRVERP